MVSSNLVITLKNYLRSKILKNDINLEESHRESLFNVIWRTVKNGESDIILIVGPSGCGKLKFINSCVSDVIAQCGPDCCDIIKLNGLIHLNDGIALKAIINQIHNKFGDISFGGSFSDNLLFLLLSIKSGTRCHSKPIVFILEECHCFCDHKNQTLLYNLFDAAKSAKVPIVVIGCTSRYDITELFEKRVKSRFSHHVIFMEFKKSISLFKNYLMITANDEINLTRSFVDSWNKHLKKLLSSPKVLRSLEKNICLSENLHSVQSSLISVINCLSDNDIFITETDFVMAFSSVSDDSRINYVKDLSVLEVCLIIAMKHHSEVYEGEPFNFKMIYERYLKFASMSSIHVIQQSVIYKAFSRIKDLEFIIPVCAGSKKNAHKEYSLYNFTLTEEEIKYALNSYEFLPTDVSQWASCSLAIY